MGRIMNKKKILIIITTIALISLLFTPLLMADPDNVISFLPSHIHIELGQNTTMNINATINDPCDTVAVDNLTFDGSIITTQSANVTSGNLFENGSIDDIVTVDNTNGWIASIVWANETLSAGTTGTLANITWQSVGCGVSQVQMTAGGTAFNGIANATTNHSCNITVHPQYPFETTAVAESPSTINVSWTPREGTDNVILEINTTSDTWARGEGTELVNLSTDTWWYVDSELSPSTTYYYQVWSYNQTANLYSLYNSSDNATTLDLSTIATEVNLYGLTDIWNITFRNSSSDATEPVPIKTWCNNSGIREETMEVNLTVNATSLVEWINVSVNDIYDYTNSQWHNASNVTVYYSGDNITFHPIRDDDGNGFGVGVDGGNNLTIRDSNWYYDNNPFDNHGTGDVINENCSIYLRFRYNLTMGMGYGIYHNQTDQPWKVWIGETTDIHDHKDFTLQLNNFNDIMDAYNEYPSDGSTDISRPPANLSAYISGTSLEVYIMYENMTGLTNTWTQVHYNPDVSDERIEYTSLDTFGTTYDFYFGNESYNWSINITDGIDWSNLSFTYHTITTVNGQNAQYEVSKNNDINVIDLNRCWTHRTVSDHAPYNRFFDVTRDGNVNVIDLNRIWSHNTI
jgi:hypothetical protein